ncbi:MAG TPA: methyltransferase domain-containing protein [Phycisphaerae bacterium]|nr:methyltransferase domain-containing protein [Phycisphaerae bacterium]HOM53836.1 methyltransferase domain-containing protein [Phycisphaerae bacterium]HON67557.1 methyltransferase domain-containing protein [Phycisphaerae bacterium]HOQ88320.1 methyltransferase domain-containing protein [Phycisphaerae bacterium]HPP29215.1 methyltransferase domain-containing protein [Phycisphaerae bacterium]
MALALATLKSWLAHPLTVGLDLDDPATTELRRRIVREKGFLRRIYQEWYTSIARALPAYPEPALELGSGGGFLREVVPNLITSEVFPCSGVDRVIDAQALPFGAGELRGIVMTNVLHHLPDVSRFFAEAVRCLRAGGALAMVEPWMTPWSCFVYRRLHHEPFDREALTWTFPTSGPLSGANGALPWIVFQRDRREFEKKFPQLRIETIQPMMPMAYLLSGGVSMRSFAPEWLYGPCRRLESLSLWRERAAMFAFIVVRRTGGPE